MDEPNQTKLKLLEAVLFQNGEPLERAELAAALSVGEAELSELIAKLRSVLDGRGLTLIETDDAITLATSKDVGEELARIREAELGVSLSKGALETLTIVLYRGPLVKSEIDYLRGVNSATMLRNLLIRGLIERTEDPKDKRSFLYRPTIELYQYLGITRREELPDYVNLEETAAQILSEKSRME